MKFLELARLRYSSRNYKNREIPREMIMDVLEAGRIAPSAANFQPWAFFVVDNEEQKTELYKAYPRDWFKTAPVLLVICGNHSKSWKRADGKDHCDIDAAIAIDHITLEAAELGLATCWICDFDTKICSSALGLPGNFEPIAILSLGFPADECDTGRHVKKRNPLGTMVHYNKFGQPY